MALCTIIVFMCAALAFLTYGFNAAVCNPESSWITAPQIATFSPANYPNLWIVHGVLYSMTGFMSVHASFPKFQTGQLDHAPITIGTGKDISAFFPRPEIASSCGLERAYVHSCITSDFPSTYAHCHDPAQVEKAVLRYGMRIGPVVYTWDEVRESEEALVVYQGAVMDLSPYIRSNIAYFGENVDAILKSRIGKDVTAVFAGSPEQKGKAECLASFYKVGQVDVSSVGCMASQIVLYISLIIILSVVLVRFIFAIYFDWFISRELGKLKENRQEQRQFQGGRKEALQRGQVPFPMKAGTRTSVVKPAATGDSAQGGSSDVEDEGGDLLTMGLGRVPSGGRRLATMRRKQMEAIAADAKRRQVANTGVVTTYESPYGKEVYTILLVTCYSEGEDGLRTTMDSLADTNYSDDHKLLFVVADGLIKGSGETRTTPEIVLAMCEMDSNWACPPQPVSYVAIGDGPKRHNMAQVYAAWYNYKDRCIPTIIVVKCGTPEEEKTPKPGNRGKRDSQIILMTFFQTVMMDERMSPLHYDVFQKIHYLMGVTPDRFEIVLMVDADTKVAPDSLPRMVACMTRDPLVMGLCGETRIANKSESWVSMIQVFEYYLSHHLNKAFESVFGGVTCLPGCFCMYRVKAPKADETWIPILANPDIVTTYSENVVDTLHKKNLLLLGEDRFLTTLMLGTFPRRKLIFVPKAYCKTVVPAQFRVLLSQRRRWINSTIHNLMELVLVRELCGIFCFSMQFIIMLELIGTVTLPAAIVFTIFLIIVSIVSAPQPIPLILLGAILGLPAVLILLTTRRRVYVAWMIVYLFSLPIWNFVLPTYAFWHFDDFSWGQTRKVEGEEAGKGGHGDGDERTADGAKQVLLKKWVDWELERRKEIREEWEESVRGGGRPNSGKKGSPIVLTPSRKLNSWKQSPLMEDAAT